MSMPTFRDQWNQLKSKVKAKWSKLTDQDIGAIDGSSDKLAAQVKERHCCTLDDANRQVDQFCVDNQVAKPDAGKLRAGPVVPMTTPVTRGPASPAKVPEVPPSTHPKPVSMQKDGKQQPESKGRAQTVPEAEPDHGQAAE